MPTDSATGMTEYGDQWFTVVAVLTPRNPGRPDTVEVEGLIGASIEAAEQHRDHMAAMNAASTGTASHHPPRFVVSEIRPARRPRRPRPSMDPAVASLIVRAWVELVEEGLSIGGLGGLGSGTAEAEAAVLATAVAAHRDDPNRAVTDHTLWRTALISDAEHPPCVFCSQIRTPPPDDNHEDPHA